MGESSRKYENGKIYCIRNTIDDDVYVGSTTQALSQRMEKHRSDFRKRYMIIPKLHTKMNEYGIENFYIERLEKCPCEDIEELRAKEGEWIRKLGTLNKCVARRTRQEYRSDNAEQIKEKKHNHYEHNKEQYQIRNQQYYKDNKEQLDNQNKEYYQNHKEEYYERNKKYREENPDKVKTYQKEYVKTNKEKIQTYQKEYRQKNKETLSKQKTTKVECQCGGRYTLCHKAEHFKRKKHQNYLNNNIANVPSLQEEANNTELQ